MKDNNPSNLTPHHYKLSFFVDLGGKKKEGVKEHLFNLELIQACFDI
jgi:hypothetical protein